ncbi:hypothetical protein ACXZ1K_13820 [Pedobacter sp. PWIIR3]
MKRFLTIISIMACAINIKAQKPNHNRVDTIDHRPALYINNKKVDALSLLLLNREDFESVVVLSPSQAFKQFAENGKYGAVQITLIKNRKLYSWPELINIFSIKPETSSLKCMVQSEEFGYKSIPAANVKLIVSSAYKINRISVKKSIQSGSADLYIEPGNDFRAPVVHTQFDKQLDSVIRVFKFEAAQRESSLSY